ncbi:MAG: metal ABC transporter solute-binding protein, Zn/Mn family [Prolixibacteraceae bacterium]
MKKYALIVLVLLGFIACNSNKKTEVKNTITVSIAPEKYFVEQIAGTTFPINVMLPAGASPDTYEPSPKQIQELNNSGIYFYIGHLGFEKSWMKKFSETASDVEYISCSNGTDLLRGDLDDSHADGEHRHGTDPHIWTSPENVKTMSRTICTTLSRKYPERAAEFEANLHTFVSRVDQLDNSIRNIITDSLNSAFMIFHPALGYYARDYHLEQYSIEFEGKSPSPAHMKKMIDLAHEKNIRTIFIQSQFETSKAEAIAQEIGAEVVTIDPLAEDWMAEMYSLTKKMEKALGSR